MTTDSVLLLATPLAVIVAAVITQYNAVKAKSAALEVKEVLHVTNKATNDKLQVIHKLVNSAMTIQLGLYSVATRRIATLTSDPADLKMATDAEKAYEANKLEQAKIASEQEDESV